MRLFIFLLFVSIIAKAQNNDTLLPKILALKSDTEKVNQLYQYGFNIRNNDPQLSFHYAKLCEQTAVQSNSKRHLAKSYNLLGILFYKKGNYKRALNYHKQALKIREECGDALGIGLSQTNLGNVYADLNMAEKAEHCYLEAIAAYKESKHEERIVACLLNIGVLKQEMKQYELAVQNYELANQLTDANDYNTKAIFLTNMAQAHIENGMIEKGIALNQDALKLRLIADNHVETADNYLNIGGAFLKLKDLLKAKYYIDTAYCIATKYDYFELKYQASDILASYFFETKDFEKAFFWQKKFSDLKDSIYQIQVSENKLNDFDELELLQTDEKPKEEVKNINLLICLLVLIITIPFILIRFKR
jgi:tetratricopeptide (TPR) repeat protein